MNGSITNIGKITLSKQELNNIPTFEQLMAEYKNSQVPSYNVFKEDGWKYKFDVATGNTMTGSGIRKKEIKYLFDSNGTLDSTIVEKGNFVNGKLDGEHCIRCIKDKKSGKITTIIGKFVNNEPQGRVFYVTQNNPHDKVIKVGNVKDNKLIGESTIYICTDYSKISGTAYKQPINYHKNNEQLWILHHQDKKIPSQSAIFHEGYDGPNQNSANILNAKKHKTSLQMLKKIPLAETTKHLKVVLDNNSNDIVNTHLIAEQIKEKLSNINKKNKQSLSSIYFSYSGKKSGYDNIQQVMHTLVKNNVSKYCFFSKIKDKYTTQLQPYFYGIKRMVINDDNNPIKLEDMAKVPNKYKEYYCVYKDTTGTIKQLMVPHDLVRNRVELIDLGKFDEALNTLQKGKTYTFTSNNLNYQLRPYDLEKGVKYGKAQPWKDCNNSPHTTLTDYYETGIIKGKESSTCHSN